MSDCRLIVNADDFGMSPAINAGVIAAHRDGIVTSASLMVRWPAAAEAAAQANATGLDLGLHVDLGEWACDPITYEWSPLYSVVATDDADGVRREVDAQVAAFVALVGRAPSHLDSHQHVHREGAARDAVARVGDVLGVPVRDRSFVLYHGGFYGSTGRGEPLPDAITVDALVDLLAHLRPGVTEVGCHPATVVDHDSPYGPERLTELAALCDPRVRAAIDELDIELIPFDKIAARESTRP